MDDRQLHGGLGVAPLGRVFHPPELRVPGASLVLDREVLLELACIRSKEQVCVTVTDVENRSELLAHAVVLGFRVIEVDERLVELQRVQPLVGEILLLDASRAATRKHVEDDSVERVVQVGITRLVGVRQI